MVQAKSMSREVALRIGMAARALEGVDVRAFVLALGAKLGEPITEEKLARVTVGDLKALLQGDEVVEPDVAGDEIKSAVRYLWGEQVADPSVPTPVAYADGDLPGSLRVAMASNNGEMVDGHFGSCVRFLVYQVTRDEARLIDVRSTLNAEDAEDKNAARAQLISDCHLVYVHSIGGPAAAKVVRADIHPVKWPEGGPALAALARLQASMASPPPWLAKIMGVTAASLERFAQDVEA
ncbi:MAG: dinitrogenase iron-molybdenum cofactor biosynthesis protein [Rhodocyclaceae bacterium]